MIKRHELRELIIRRRADGLTYDAIGKEAGVSRQTLWTFCKEENLRPPRGEQPKPLKKTLYKVKLPL